jgi:hypothetical protein
MTNDKRVAFLQYLNTAILTLIFGCSMLIFITLNNVKTSNEALSKELILVKERQNVNITNISNLNTRVTILETNTTENIKTWTENNFIRKPQK